MRFIHCDTQMVIWEDDFGFSEGKSICFPKDFDFLLMPALRYGETDQTELCNFNSFLVHS